MTVLARRTIAMSCLALAAVGIASAKKKEKVSLPGFVLRAQTVLVMILPDHSELKRPLYTANFVFVFKTNVPNDLIPINPLGLAITYFREDEAFK